MRSSSLVVTAVVGLAAPVAFVVAYQSWSPPPTVAAAARAPATHTVAATTAPTKVRLRPCEAGTRLRHGVCVSHQVRTVIVPVVPAPRLSPPTSGTATPDDGPDFQGEDADEPTATPGQQDDDQSEPECAANQTQDRHTIRTSDSQCGDDGSADAPEPQETQSADTEDSGEHESDDVEHEGGGGTGDGTGTDD